VTKTKKTAHPRQAEKAESRGKSRMTGSSEKSSTSSRSSAKPGKKVRGELGGPNEQLWRDYQKTGNPEIRNQFMEMYLPVVHFIAERLAVTLPNSVEVDDLKSAGIFGLMDAINGFDLSRGIKFKTYCSTRIRGAILDDLRSQDWVPRLVRLRAHQLTRARVALEARHGREPTHAEMAKQMKLSLDDYSALSEEASPHSVRSLSETWDDGSGDTAAEKISFVKDQSSPDPADLMNQEDVMRSIIRSLNQREKQIMLMYYRDGFTMKKIGELLTLTESRVCQIHSNVIRKLKVHLDNSKNALMM